MNKKILLAGLIVLVLSFQYVTTFLASIFFDLESLYIKVGYETYFNIMDLFSLVMPLCLALSAPIRSGLVIGEWREHFRKIVFFISFPVVLAFIIYRFTGQPFKDANIGVWLISPLAQDLFFGFIFGVILKYFPGDYTFRNIRVKKSLLLIGILFSLWHIPNFQTGEVGFVTFQLIYTFIFAFMIYHTRLWTGSILPILITHMLTNYLAWHGV